MISVLRDPKFWRDVRWGFLGLIVIPLFIVMLPIVALGFLGSACRDLLDCD